MSETIFTPGILTQVFKYHAPSDPAQIARYQALRDAAMHFAMAIVQNTPPSADQAAAVRKVREAVMTANAAIALEGLV